MNKWINESSDAYSRFLTNYDIKGTLIGEVSDASNNEFYFAYITFNKDGISIEDRYDEKYLFIDADDVADYMDIGMGNSQFSFDLHSSRIGYSISMKIAQKSQRNIISKF